MHPWGSELTTESKELVLDSFEDNFIPPISDCLPDSEQYLDQLERKLRKIKTDPNLVRQLADKREDYMLRLLTEGCDITTDDNLILDSALHAEGRAQQLLRHIRPEQALTVGEAVEIIKYDFLDNTLQEQNDSDNADSASR